MNRIDRLTAMILMLQGRRVTTAEQIAEHFEISVRTVYRDIAALGEAGVPILAEAGVGYALERGYHMPPVMFTEEEAAAIFVSGELTEQFGDASLKKSLGSALLKVRGALPEERKDYIAKLSNTVGITTRHTGLPHENCLMPVQEAAVRKRRLTLDYNAGNRGEITTRTVDPLAVVFYGNRWHLVAHCHLRDDLRDFRLDRIQKLEVLPETFTGHDEFSLIDYLNHEVDDAELTAVTLEFERWALERVLAEIPCRIVSRESLPDSRVRIDALAYSLDWLTAWLLGLGTATTVISPGSLREKLAAAALEVAAHHKKSPSPQPS